GPFGAEGGFSEAPQPCKCFASHRSLEGANAGPTQYCGVSSLATSYLVTRFEGPSPSGGRPGNRDPKCTHPTAKLPASRQQLDHNDTLGSLRQLQTEG
ncbi:Hypothetical predicted protein, partial [Olea europaea subsp. europaea]